MRRVWIALIAAVLAILVLVVPVLAVADPDSRSVNEVYAYRNLIETGDVLVLFRYTVAYAAPPTEPIDDTFIFRLIDTDGTTELAQVLAYPYFENGYGTGISAFYFSAADNLTWGSAYSIRISGNPVYLPALADANTGISASAWYSSNETLENQAALAARIIDMVGTLEVSWSATLTTTNSLGQTVLNSSGQTYLVAAIPGVTDMAPAAFSVQLYNMTYTGIAWATTQADAYHDRFVGTWVQDAADAFGEITTFNFQLAMSLPFLFASIMLIVAYRVKFEQGGAALMDVVTLRYLWVLLGWISLGVSAVITLILAAVLGFILLFDRG